MFRIPIAFILSRQQVQKQTKYSNDSTVVAIPQGSFFDLSARALAQHRAGRRDKSTNNYPGTNRCRDSPKNRCRKADMSAQFKGHTSMVLTPSARVVRKLRRDACIP